MAYLATLASVDLPELFSYRPYLPKKRSTTTKTAGAVITQYAAPSQVIHGGGFLAWTVRAGYPSEYQQFRDWYETAGPVLYDFTGYWGEEYRVLFSDLAEATVRGRLFSFSGRWQVVCVTSAIAATC